MLKRLIAWFHPPKGREIQKLKNWITPPHECKVFKHFYGMNLKQCVQCDKESPIGEDHFIKHQR